ncbi:hypothetical protein LG299_15515 [Microbacterium lacus]|uniref:polysaccharide deacetylase WbmS family protein n=1 Tax=Microbacterium lacus TaxID=415217 RepID=UPI00384FAF69
MHEAFITIDVDWAPDWAMRRLLNDLLEAELRSTWFITHETPVLDELRARRDLVELGVHPNFQPGSSHGATPSAVLAECMRIVPEARTMRTHCLVQSTPILQTVVDESPLVLDASVYIRDLTSVRVSELPLDRGRSLARVPYVWEDDLEFFARDPHWDAVSFLAGRSDRDELTVMDLHPIHYVLNSADVKPYQALKAAVGDTRMVDEVQAGEFANKGAGTASFVASLRDARRELAIEFNTPLSQLANRI